MFNVRIIEYPTGYQVRVYDNMFGEDKEDEKREKREKKPRKELESDVWYDSPFDFEYLETYTEDEKKESLRISANRTKNTIYYLARSNVWEWFVTFTLDKEKVDRYDYLELSKKVRKTLNNLKSRVAPDLYYLIVPEQHEDGAWHFHGLIGGCAGLVFSDSGKYDDGGNKIYNLDDYKLGWSYATMIRDTARASSYICKYISKDMCGSISGRNRYWVSKNLNRAKTYDVVVPWYMMREFRIGLLDNMTWKKKVFTEFFDMEYFEVSKEWDAVQFIDEEVKNG